MRCLPPANKPMGAEVSQCNGYLAWELGRVPAGGVVLALGGVAHRAILKALSIRQATAPFGHENWHDLPGRRRLVDSYHCSRYNTQTRRLTGEMFSQVFASVRTELDVHRDGPHS